MPSTKQTQQNPQIKTHHLGWTNKLLITLGILLLFKEVYKDFDTPDWKNTITKLLLISHVRDLPHLSGISSFCTSRSCEMNK